MRTTAISPLPEPRAKLHLRLRQNSKRLLRGRTTRPRASFTQRASEPLSALTVTVVIPCYQVHKQLKGVIRSLPGFIRHIIVVDDACPQASGDVAEAVGDPRVVVLRHPHNRGVGGAMKTGFQKALDLGADAIIKMDGDGQRDPRFLLPLLEPLAAMRAAFS